MNRRSDIFSVLRLDCIQSTFLAFIFFALITACSGVEQRSYIELSDTVLIAHAGGGIDEGNYTNSRQALNASAARGFKYIEIDFLTLDDGTLVLLHDWDAAYKAYFSRAPKLSDLIFENKLEKAQTIKEFKALKMRHGLTQMDLSDLLLWMAENPDVFIVTDFKQDDYLAALSQISEKSGLSKSNFIPQIYKFEDYDDVKALGYKQLILTSYKMNAPISDLFAFAKTHPLFAVTIPKHRVKIMDAETVGLDDILILTHTVNDPVEAESFSQMGIDGFYTDIFYPKK